jgi:hypothetical protein
MTDPSKAWDGAQVRKWLERRLEVSLLDQARADRHRHEARDDYDQAAAEEWVCRALKDAACTGDQVEFAARIKTLLGQDAYPATSTYDDTRFERHVRSYLRKLAKMTKTNEGFGKTLRHQ